MSVTNNISVLMALIFLLYGKVKIWLSVQSFQNTD